MDCQVCSSSTPSSKNDVVAGAVVVGVGAGVSATAVLLLDAVNV